jgi:hypothetical protein
MRTLLAGAAGALLLTCVWTARARCGQATGETEAQTVREAGDADLFGTGAEEENRGKTFVFGVYTGVQYDDNITLESMGVDVESTDRTDWKSVHAVQIDYRALNTEERVVGLRYRVYQSFIDINNELQLTGHTFTGYCTTMRAPYVFFFPASFSRYNLYWHKYLDIYSVTPSVYVEQGPNAVGVMRLGWTHNNYFQLEDNGFDEHERDGDNLSVGFEEWLLFGEKAEYRVEFGYTFRREYTRADEWANFSHKVRLGLGAQLPWFDLTTGGFVAYEARDYFDENPAFGKTQEEDVMTYGVTISRPLWKDATATLSYLFTDNESNVVSQDYERSQITLGVMVQF